MVMNQVTLNEKTTNNENIILNIEKIILIYKSTVVITFDHKRKCLNN